MTPININVIIILIVICCIYYYHYKKSIRENIFDRLTETLVTFTRAKEVAYRKIFGEKILVHSSSGFRVNKEDIKETQALYIKLVFRCCGPSIINDLKIMHGDLDSICAIISNEFVQRVEQDEAVIADKIIEKNEDDMEG